MSTPPSSSAASSRARSLSTYPPPHCYSQPLGSSRGRTRPPLLDYLLDLGTEPEGGRMLSAFLQDEFRSHLCSSQRLTIGWTASPNRVTLPLGSSGGVISLSSN